jgi:hypothetical protein
MVDFTYPAIGIETDAIERGGTSTKPVQKMRSAMDFSSKTPNSIPAFCFCSAVNLTAVLTAVDSVAASFPQLANKMATDIMMINLFIS